MLPLRDNIRAYSFPFVNYLLIGINTLVFFFEISLSMRGLEGLIYNFGLVPARLNLANPIEALLNPEPWFTLLTHMFLHGGWIHFLSNVWILFIFGDNVEDRMGHGRYLVFYLFSGLVSGLMQALISPSSQIPAIGASGAIAGILGAYFILFPGARVVTLIPIFLFPWFVEIPALFYLGFWFISQLFSGLASLNIPESASMGGIAWWAHIGGFMFGIFFYRLFTPRDHPALPRSYNDYPNEY